MNNEAFKRHILIVMHMSTMIDHHLILHSFTIYSLIHVSFDFSSSSFFFSITTTWFFYIIQVYFLPKELDKIFVESDRQSIFTKFNSFLAIWLTIVCYDQFLLGKNSIQNTLVPFKVVFNYDLTASYHFILILIFLPDYERLIVLKLLLTSTWYEQTKI